MNKKTLAIDLGGTSAQLAVLEENYDLVHRWKVPTDPSDGGQYIVPNLIASIRDALDELSLEISDFHGIGMGAPGKVDNQSGRVEGAFNLGWDQPQELRQALQEVLDLPVQMDNDANVAALGEQWQGAGNREANIVMMTLGTGLGGGIVIHGRLYHGSSLVAGEIGHIPVFIHGGFLCTCGKKGCLETVASATGVVNLAKYRSQEQGLAEDFQKNLEKGRYTAKDVFAWAQDGDTFGQEIFQEYTDYLAWACGIIANTLNPSKIILGGGVALAGDFLLEAVREKVVHYMYPPTRESTQVVLAQLVDDAALYGAARLLLQSKE